MVRHYLMIRGAVQGVSYRKSTKRVAEELQVKGWVRNLATGEVEACLEGEQAAVDEMIDWCRHGPPSSRVEEVAVAPAEYSNEFLWFEIR